MRHKTPADYRKEIAAEREHRFEEQRLRLQEAILREELSKELDAFKKQAAMELDAFKKQAQAQLVESNRRTVHAETQEVMRREEIKRLTSELEALKSDGPTPSFAVPDGFAEVVIRHSWRLAVERLEGARATILGLATRLAELETERVERNYSRDAEEAEEEERDESPST